MDRIRLRVLLGFRQTSNETSILNKNARHLEAEETSAFTETLEGMMNLKKMASERMKEVLRKAN